MNWDALKYFLAVARKENLTDAANFLKVSPSTASKRIADLEENLETKLFNKRTTGYYLTTAGEAILPIAQKIESQMQFIDRKSSFLNQNRSSIIKIDLPELLGTFIIMPILADFKKQNENVSIQFINSVLNTKLSGNASDIVLRLSVPTAGAYKIKRIGSVVQAAYCSQTFYEENKEKLNNNQLQDIPFIGWVNNFEELPATRWLLDITKNINISLQTSSLYAQLTATSAGFGVSVLPSFAAKQHGLINVFSNYPPLESDLWLMRNVETLNLSDIDNVIEYITKAIKQNKSLLETA